MVIRKLWIFWGNHFLSVLLVWWRKTTRKFLSVFFCLSCLSFVVRWLVVYCPYIGSMYGIFTYIWLIFMVNLGKYTNPMDPLVGWLPMRAARCCCFTTRNHLRSGSFPSAQQPIWRLGNAIPEKGWVPNRANGLEVLFPAQNRGIYSPKV